MQQQLLLSQCKYLFVYLFVVKMQTRYFNCDDNTLENMQKLHTENKIAYFECKHLEINKLLANY